MKKLVISIGLGVLLLIGIGYTISLNTKIRENTSVSADNIRSFIKQQLDLGYRIPGTNGSQAFQSWIIDTISSPWKIETLNFSYKDTSLRNYWITSENTDQWPTYIFGAHYDTRAVADQDPDHPQQPVPGANDGGSGVAAILEMLSHLSAQERQEVGFVLFDAEDQGSISQGKFSNWDWIVGSTHFANQMTTSEVEQTEAFILFDMIADDDLRLPYEGNSNKTIREEIWDIGIELGYDDIFVKEMGTTLTDDHVPFITRGIPSVDLIDFNYPEWHTTEDDLDHISAENAAIVLDTALVWLKEKISEKSISQSKTTDKTTSMTTNDETSIFGYKELLLVAILVTFTRKIKPTRF